MDHKGARVEAEAAIAVEATAFMPKKIKKFILNKPFYLVFLRFEIIIFLFI